MLIKDHLNFPSMAGNNPLVGHNDERLVRRNIFDFSFVKNVLWKNFLHLDSVCKREEVFFSPRKSTFVHLKTGPRFPPVSQAYDREYLSVMKEVAKKHNLDLAQGIYCGLGRVET